MSGGRESLVCNRVPDGINELTEFKIAMKRNSLYGMDERLRRIVKADPELLSREERRILLQAAHRFETAVHHARSTVFGDASYSLARLEESCRLALGELPTDEPPCSRKEVSASICQMLVRDDYATLLRVLCAQLADSERERKRRIAEALADRFASLSLR